MRSREDHRDYMRQWQRERRALGRATRTVAARRSNGSVRIEVTVTKYGTQPGEKFTVSPTASGFALTKVGAEER